MTSSALSGYSACIEMLFVPEAETYSERIRLAADAGFDAVEFWGRANKDVGRIADAAQEAGVAVAGFLSEPAVALTDPANHGAYLAGLEDAKAAALALGARVLIVVAGAERPGVPREAQRTAVVDCLRHAADVVEGTGIVLALEPINRGERPDGFLWSTPEALDIVDEVDRPEVRILYDMYHSAYMGETLSEVLAGRVDRIGHVHLADHPGRHEPGTGTIRWREGLAWLRSAGYAGRVGLEYRPLASTVAGLATLGPLSRAADG